MRKLRHSKVNYLVQSDKTSKWDRNYSIVNFPELSIILNNWRGKKKKKKTLPSFGRPIRKRQHALPADSPVPGHGIY